MASRLDFATYPGLLNLRRDPCAPVAPPQECPPPCPACGGLECLCRPRFFPGQLLTDEDLTRLERYIVEKNKLHNRYLHGWGVVCGLEVVCDPCTTTSVIVQTGYALSPCGEDIVVCKDQSVDVCDLIKVCRDDRTPQCDPPYDNPPRECGDGIERWVLAICYDERPSRGVTTLRGDSGAACCSTCACGGSGACGCKGGGHATTATPASGATATATRTRREHRPQCEPTLTCEGYIFRAYREPKRLDPGVKPDFGRFDRLPGEQEIVTWIAANRDRFGPLLTRLLCCYLRGMAIRVAYRERQVVNRDDARRAYDDYVGVVRDFTAEHGRHHCAAVRLIRPDYARRFDEIVGAQPERLSVADLSARLDTQLALVDATWLQIVRECVCSALLPPCPDPVATDCVPLAVVTVRTRDCAVLEICNWQERKFAVTLTNLKYWFSWLPWQTIRQVIEQICCTPGGERTLFFLLSVLTSIVQAPAAAPAPAGGLAAGLGAFAAARAEAEGADPVRETLGADHLMETFARAFERFEATGTAPVEAAPLLALAQRATSREGLAQLLAFTSPAGMADAAAVRGEMADLRKTVEDLTQTVRQQHDVLTRLQRGGNA
jgi:hypothetical protein